MEKKTEADIQDTGKSEAPADEKRRRLAKAALATPVLGALASKSALGAARQCSASVLMSGNTSTPVDYLTCNGCSPGFWLKAVFNNATSHACHWPCDIDAATATVRDVFELGLYATLDPLDSSATVYDIVREKMAQWKVSELHSNFKGAFVEAVRPLTSDNGLGYARKLFNFTTAAFTATLNAKTLGAAFPVLLDNPLPSESTISGYVSDVFDAANKVTSKANAISLKDTLHLSWDDDEKRACSMFSNCHGSAGCGEL